MSALLLVLLVLLAIVWYAEGISEYRQQRAPPRTLPPGARPVKVRLAMQPIKVLEVDADSATVRMQAYFDQFWNDARLARLPNSTDEELDAFDRTINATDGARRRFYLSEALPWTPDTTFSSASERQDLQTVGDIDPYYSMTFTRVFENGDVHRSQRIEITLPVEFAIEYFPFEVVPVIITIESYGFTNDAVAYELINYDAATNSSESLVSLNETKLLPGYRIGEFSKSTPLFTDYIEGTYTGVRFEFLIEGSSNDVIITAGTTTTVLVLLAGIPLWYDTDFNTKMTIIATMLLTAFALTFSFTRPEARKTLFLELFLLSHQLFIAFVGFVVFVSYVLTKLRKALLVPPTGDHQRQDVAVERMISHLRRKSSRNTEPVSAPDSKKQLAVLMLIEEALRDEKTSDFAPVKPWKLFTVLAYMFTWLVNLFAFYSAGLVFKRQALKGRFDTDSTLQLESGVIFISIYCVGIPVMLCLAFLASSIWRRKQEAILFSLASFVVLRFRGDTDEAEHATQLKNIQRRQSSKALAIPEAKETGKQAAAHDDANMTSARDSATTGTQRLRFSTAVHELNADADDDDDVENSDLPMPPRDD